MSDQSGDSRSAGVILTQHLTEKDPQRDQGRKDAIDPVNIIVGEGLGDDRLRQHIAKRQVAILKKLTLEKLKLLSKPWPMNRTHLRTSFAVDESLPESITTTEIAFAYLIFC
jgi:hypothetical protein